MFNIPPGELLQHLLNGLTLGSIYALIALGYTMVYGILKFINFAHGEIMMIGAYAGLFCYLKLNPEGTTGPHAIMIFILALLAAITASGVLGVAVERIAYRPLRRASRLAPLLSAIGVSIILVNTAGLFFGTEARKFPYPFDNTPFTVFGASISPMQILTLTVSFTLMLLLDLFVRKSLAGKAMRATSEKQEVASLMGINIDRIISLTFLIGSGLGAIAGVLTALEYKVYPTLGTLTGLKAFIAAVVGGIGNIRGAMLGGLLLGILETFGVVVLGIPQGLKDTIAFTLLILILLFRPSGILGKYIREKV